METKLPAEDEFKASDENVWKKDIADGNEVRWSGDYGPIWSEDNEGGIKTRKTGYSESRSKEEK